ncbi:transcriptional activator, Rgg/GadR/MutR family domain-containing protein [Enterococcus quebecensis]|nr:transcriptional activator, Rgg/GadR/MutR family domain-containing protein [Enterococcus quebecensis]
MLKKIRQEKGLSQKDVYEGLMTRQTYYLIETNTSMPSFDKFLIILEKLFLSVEEFLELLDPTSFPTENHLYQQLSHAVFKKDEKMFDLLIEKSQQLYTATNNKKYFHLNLITQAMTCLNKEQIKPEDMAILKQLLFPIKQYLIGIDKWYLYELRLLNNSLYCFELSEAIALGILVGKKIDRLSNMEDYQDIKLRIYLNLSCLCLNNQDYENTMYFSILAKENAKKDYRLFETIIANLNYEIAQVANQEKQINDKITKYLTILDGLDYQETIYEYQKTLSKNHIH